MNAKLLIVILGALIVLFFVGTSWGLLSDDQSVGGVAETVVNAVRGLQERGKEPLESSDVIGAAPANCREQLRQRRFTLDEGRSCQLEVAESSVPVRTLRLRLERGNEARLRMRAGEDDREHTETLPVEGEDGRTDDEIELQFVPEGGRLFIRCASGGLQGRCILNVVSS